MEWGFWLGHSSTPVLSRGERCERVYESLGERKKWMVTVTLIKRKQYHCWHHWLCSFYVSLQPPRKALSWWVLWIIHTHSSLNNRRWTPLRARGTQPAVSHPGRRFAHLDMMEDHSRSLPRCRARERDHLCPRPHLPPLQGVSSFPRHTWKLTIHSSTYQIFTEHLMSKALCSY